MFVLICMSYMHVILCVGKSSHGKFQLGFLWGEKIGGSAWEVEHMGQGERDVAAHWYPRSSIKIYRCWDSTDLRHYSW